MNLNRPDLPKLFLLGGLGVMVSVWWALIWLAPVKAPDILVKFLVVGGVVTVAMGAAFNISEWIIRFVSN